MAPAKEPSRASAERAARVERREAALAARPEMSPEAPAPDRFRVASWNVNSLRARAERLQSFLERTLPDVLCLQETRGSSIPPAAADVLDRLGYATVHAGSGSSNGVAVASRHPVSDAVVSGELGDEHLDGEPRVAACIVRAPAPFGPTPVRVVSVYVPHGREVNHWHYDYKLAFLHSLAEQVRAWLSDGVPLVVGCDVNVAPTDSDVFHPNAFSGSTHVTPLERKALSTLLDAGLVDVDAERWGAGARRFTWWNHGIGYSRNLGMRIDLVAADRVTAERLDTTWIDHVERGAERPSDHAALVADFLPVAAAVS